MANVFFPNSIVNTNTASNSFSVVWKLSRAMKKAGWVVKAHSDGTTKTAAGTNANDSWGTNADPASDTYPTAFDTKAPWEVLSGPVTIKVPITVACTGTFLRGEKVTQATSGVEGECLGYVFDTVSSTGWLTILDRTGYNTTTYTNTWDGTHLITGASSGATLTPSATTVAYVREVCFWKQSTGSVITGTIYYTCADASGESAGLYSTLASATGCTAIIAPGGGGTSNSFPAQGLVINGTGGSAGGNNLFYFGSAISVNCQIVATNAAGSTGVSPDGTFWALLGQTSSSTLFGWGYFRMDDSEPGDLDPFVWLAQDGTAPASFSRTATTAGTNSLNATAAYGSSGISSWRGYINRGNDSGTPNASYFYGTCNNLWLSNVAVAVQNQSSTMQIQNYPGSTKPLTREPFRIFTDLTSHKMYKGTVRWMSLFPIGSVYDTFDNKLWICVLTQATTTNPAMGLGPWDGSTIPASG